MTCPKCHHNALIIAGTDLIGKDRKASCLACGFWCWLKYLASYNNNKTMICIDCQKEIEKFGNFPGPRCLACHAKEYDKHEHNESGADLANSFKFLINNN